MPPPRRSGRLVSRDSLVCGNAFPSDADRPLDSLLRFADAQEVVYEDRSYHPVHRSIQIGIRPYLAAVHSTLKHLKRLGCPRTDQALAEPFEQVCVPTLSNQQSAEHREARALLERSNISMILARALPVSGGGPSSSRRL